MCEYEEVNHAMYEASTSYRVLDISAVGTGVVDEGPVGALLLTTCLSALALDTSLHLC